MKLASGHIVENLSEEEERQQKKDYEAYSVGLVRLQPGGWIFNKPFVKFADKYYAFKFKTSDVVIMTYPKCGTTWLQEIIWTMRNNPDLQHPMANLPISSRAPFMELDFLDEIPTLVPFHQEEERMQLFKKLCPGVDIKEGFCLAIATAAHEPRTIKTHLAFSFLSPHLLDTCKVVYSIRNAKDMILSYCHHSRILKNHGFKGDVQGFLDYFLKDNLMYGPYWLHLKEAWQKKSHPNLHFVFYEDLKSNPIAEIKRLDQFIGTKLTEKQLENINEYSSFAAMKGRNALIGREEMPKYFYMDIVNKDGDFFRKGEAGSYNSELTAEQRALIDEWMNENLKGVDIPFK